MKTRIQTILLLFSVTILLSLVLFTEIITTANAVDEASQSILHTDAGSVGTQEEAAAAVDSVITIIIDGGEPICVNSVTKSPDQPSYNIGDIVSLSAVPDPACLFDHWDGAITGTVSPKSLTVDGSDDVTTYFKKRCFTLTRLHTGSGLDPVASPSNSIECPTPGDYVAGEVINLSATPDLHWTISNWDTNTGTSTFTMPKNDYKVIVNYTPICYTLTTSVDPEAGGSITRSPDPDCPDPIRVAEYYEGTTVSLTAHENLGYEFTGWVGIPLEELTQTLVTMDADHSVIANIPPACHPLILDRNETNWGSVPSANPPNSPKCDFGKYKVGEEITLSAEPAEDYQIQHWEGTNNNTNILTFPALPVNRDHNVTVHYIKKPTLEFSKPSFTIQENEITATVTVTRTGSLIENVNVKFETSADTAFEPEDYTDTSGELSFASGVNVNTFEVYIEDDDIAEGPEKLNLILSDPQNGAILGAQDTAELIIQDNEGPPTVQFEPTAYEVVESTPSIPVTITLFPASTEEIFVKFITIPDTATSGEDYNGEYDRDDDLPNVNFEPGDTTKTIEITLINDNLDEFDETVYVQILKVVNAEKDPAQSKATITILDDDDPPTVQFDDNVYLAHEGDPTAPLTITLNAPSTMPITVDYAVVNVPVGQQSADTMPFNPGEVSKTIDVPIGNNKAGDALSAVLSGAEYATLAYPSSATLIILDKNRSDCHLLTLNYTGYGLPPVPTNMPNSLGCPEGHYVANDLIDVSGQPDPGWFIDKWQGTENDNNASHKNVVRMPDGDHSVTVYYLTSAVLSHVSNVYVDYFDGPFEVEPNNALDTSKANGPLRSGQRYNGSFSTASDSYDIFFFAMVAKGNVQIDLKNIPAGHDYNLYLYNIDSDLKGYSGLVDTQEEHISRGSLDPGVYFVAINNASGAPTTALYSLTVTFE